MKYGLKESTYSFQLEILQVGSRNFNVKYGLIGTVCGQSCELGLESGPVTKWFQLVIQRAVLFLIPTGIPKFLGRSPR